MPVNTSVAPPRREIRHLLWPVLSLLAGVGLLALFLFFCEKYFPSLALPLGSYDEPTPGFFAFSAMWLLLSVPAAALLAWGFSRLSLGGSFGRIFPEINPLREEVWLLLVAVLAVVVPIGLRALVLGEAPLTDDEGAYELMARLVASGRLYAASPPLKAHFDTTFMVNDGKYYSNYFLGWPILMAPGVLLGIAKYINALYSGVLALGLFLVTWRVVGASWARLAGIVYVTSVLHMVGAATQLSHTTCAAALIWLLWSVLRSQDSDAPPWIHALVAVLFSLAVFIRPLTALGLGTPFLIQWLRGVLVRRRRLVLALSSFGTTATVFAVVFLGVNWIQCGSPWVPPYQAYLKFATSNGFAYSPWGSGYDAAVANMSFEPVALLAGLAGTLYRVNVESYGWPCLLLMLLAVGATGSACLWASLGGFLLLNAGVVGAGIDTFGPIKFTEFSVIALVLVLLGLDRATRVIERIETQIEAPAKSWSRLPMAFAASLVLLSLIGYVPPRIATVAKIAEAVTTPQRTLAANGITSALVFTWPLWTPQCATQPARHFVLRSPYPDPNFDNPILWVNHLSVEKDAVLRERYADRPAFVLEWERCRPLFVPFESYLSNPSKLPPVELQAPSAQRPGGQKGSS